MRTPLPWFQRMFAPTGPFRDVNTIAWDLDGTLGVKPGWDGGQPLTAYIVAPARLRAVPGALRGVEHVVVSRNGMFCGAEYAPTEAAFRALGFDRALPCFRHLPHSKVTWFADPRTTLLIDDNVQECTAAAADGAHALWIRDPLLRAGPENAFAVPPCRAPLEDMAAPSQPRRRTRRR